MGFGEGEAVAVVEVVAEVAPGDVGHKEEEAGGILEGGFNRHNTIRGLLTELAQNAAFG